MASGGGGILPLYFIRLTKFTFIYLNNLKKQL